ncbi:hypothetical protein AZE42_09647 [Rhizopogon vesiculosus]|uniref:Uncharacterized protein n=1 Tax=Rhizopogon vesiculosus TaxID=180088 RepID=A0A1J8QCV6_9AGAM|nr:hypothetical protein AZE42_09647 [Rhizopogon vesiculosus]
MQKTPSIYSLSCRATPRMMERETHVVMMMLRVHVELDVSSEQLVAYAYARNLLKTPGGIPSACDYPEDEFQRDYAFFIHPLGKAKGINDVMWETIAQKAMAQEKQDVIAERRRGTAPLAITGELMDKDDVERPRKDAN